MTRQTSFESPGGGGTKKFLYTAPKRKGAALFGDEPVPGSSQQPPQKTTEDSFKNTASESLNDAWSIKNLNINGTSRGSNIKPSSQEGWTRNVERGFYSRHGGLSGENETANRNSQSPSTDMGSSNRSWMGSQQPKSFSYATNNSSGLSNNSGLPNNSNSKHTSNGKPNSLNTAGRHYGIQPGGVKRQF